MKRRLRLLGRVRRRWWFLAAGAVALLVVAGPMVWVRVSGQRGIVALDDVDPAPVAIVFGAGVHPDGTPTSYLVSRLQAALRLYEAGKVSVILVSGDNGRTTYDEPTAMADWLVDHGVPRDRVVADYAGFSSHDTCVRAVDVFGVTDAVLVTQDFHLPRAMYLCRGAGLHVQGVAVPAGHDPWYAVAPNWVREAPASWKAWWDRTTNQSPTYPGPQETSITEILDEVAHE
ncbi:MAG: YdcF family protein [Micrococcales bacterium]|nr:YdcF family protein [Micrococcales bacterium]MCL2669005.1 YdcF family protein [Micrococcales bacterium]